MPRADAWAVPGRPPGNSFHLASMRATALAYRAAMGRGDDQMTCVRLADQARIGAGGRPDDLYRTTSLMIAEVSGRYPEWFWAPTKRRISWEEHCLRAAGYWPPPPNPRDWPPIPPMPDGP